MKSPAEYIVTMSKTESDFKKARDEWNDDPCRATAARYRSSARTCYAHVEITAETLDAILAETAAYV